MVEENKKNESSSANIISIIFAIIAGIIILIVFAEVAFKKIKPGQLIFASNTI